MAARKVVIFKEKYGQYNAGETAGFPASTADKLVGSGRAVYKEEQKKSALSRAVTKRSAPKTSPKKDEPKPEVETPKAEDEKEG